MRKPSSSVTLSAVPPSTGGTKSKPARPASSIKAGRGLTLDDEKRARLFRFPESRKGAESQSAGLLYETAGRREVYPAIGGTPRNGKTSIIVLGIDPGTLVTGYGVVARRGNEVRMIDCGSIKNRAESSMPLRLKKIYEGLCSVIEQHHPDEFAIESAFYGKNAQSALKLGHARGVSILAAVEQENPTTEYSPREVKRAIVGSGAASKKQVQFMVKSLLGLSNSKMLHDTSDALAIAICHAQRMTTPTAKHKDWKSFIEAHPERVRS